MPDTIHAYTASPPDQRPYPEYVTFAKQPDGSFVLYARSPSDDGMPGESVRVLIPAAVMKEMARDLLAAVLPKRA